MSFYFALFKIGLLERFKITQIDSDSEFVYFGIDWQLKKIINTSLHTDNTILLKLSMD